jgi:peptide/nickel transport system permease protein|tara:strand:+ start:5051 stop:5986 length:936 start_codon:yes stop_codon:yes gene_type:complete
VLAYAIQRIIVSILIIILAVTALFVMIQFVPGDPANVMLGPRATPELKEALRERLHLNDAFIVQVYYFFTGLLQGDLGVDLTSNRPVLGILIEQVPYTASLVASTLLVTLLGIPIGTYAAVHRDGFFDQASGVVSVSLIAVPPIVIGLYLILFFSVSLQLLPAIGAGEGFWEILLHLVLPTLAIGLTWIGYVSRLVRASMIEVLGQNHVKTARAFGIPNQRILRAYVLRVALPATITVLGVSIGFILSSAVIVEIVFSRPGIGKLMYDAVISRNYPVVMGTVLASTVFIVTATTISDLLNVMLDPRTKDEN